MNGIRDGRKQVVAVTLVDDADAATALKWGPWHLDHAGYPVHTARVDESFDGRRHTFRLSRVLCDLPHGDKREVDHRNGDILDNRRRNLRVVTTAINAQNKPSMRDSSSRFRGVTWDSEKRKWLAQAKLDRRNHYLGRYDNEEEAAEAARRFREANMPGTVEDRHAA